MRAFTDVLCIVCILLLNIFAITNYYYHYYYTRSRELFWDINCNYYTGDLNWSYHLLFMLANLKQAVCGMTD